MGKKGSWFAAVRNIFKSNSKDSAKVKAIAVQFTGDRDTNEVVTHNKIKRSKDKGRWSFGKSKHVENPEIVKPGNLERRISTTVENDQDKHALAVAAASAAAAEAAVAAAFAAAEVVRLTGGAQSPSLASLNRHLNGEAQHPSSISLKREDWAAIKIQTAFRGYLARRALRALRGLVRLQALVRGHAVRRQAIRTFKCMQALVRVQARIRAMHSKTSEDGQGLQWQPLQKNERPDQKKRELGDPELEIWDDTLQSVEGKVARTMNKKEAALKRERALAYAVSHQSWKHSPQQASSPCTGRESDQLHWGCAWLERWMAARSWEAPHFADSYASELIANQIKINPLAADLGTPRKSITSAPLPKGRSVKAIEQTAANCVPMTMTPQRQSCGMASCNAEEGSLLSTGGSVSSACSVGHRFGNSRNDKAGSSIADDDSVASPPRVPNYMTSTHSAKAKARSRSLSTPKQRTATPERERIIPSSVRKRLSFPATEGSVGSARSTPKHPRALGLTERSPSLKCFPVSSVETERYIASYA